MPFIIAVLLLALLIAFVGIKTALIVSTIAAVLLAVLYFGGMLFGFWFMTKLFDEPSKQMIKRAPRWIDWQR